MNKQEIIEEYLQDMRRKGGKARWKNKSKKDMKNHMALMLKRRYEILKEKGLAKNG